MPQPRDRHRGLYGLRASDFWHGVPPARAQPSLDSIRSSGLLLMQLVLVATLDGVPPVRVEPSRSIHSAALCRCTVAFVATSRTALAVHAAPQLWGPRRDLFEPSANSSRRPVRDSAVAPSPTSPAPLASSPLWTSPQALGLPARGPPLSRRRAAPRSPSCPAVADSPPPLVFAVLGAADTSWDDLPVAHLLDLLPDHHRSRHGVFTQLDTAALLALS